MYHKKQKKASINAFETAQTKNRLIEAATQDQKTLFSIYHTSLQGHTIESHEEMAEAYGENIITHQKGDSLAKRLFQSFVNPFSIVLFILVLISIVTDVLIVSANEREFTSIVIVLTMILLSGTLHFIQETKSSNAAERLSEMVKTTIAIERNPQGKAEISISEIAVGDIIHLASGDMIPADIRILQAKDLFVSQSSLTGESEPVEKYSTTTSTLLTNPLEINSLGFMGSNVISGSAKAIVIAVGDNTIFGSIAQHITGKKPITSFELGVNSVSWVLIRFMMVMAPVVLFLNGFTKGNWLDAFIFALSVAVGLTPEMLPMIVSANLSKGAVALSRKKVIVKNLSSIQNLGAMDVLCTDKTGTLTQDKVVLEYSLDIHGNEDSRVLRHAFLNSYHQTGLKNLMDIAIIQHESESEMLMLCKDYKKVDEIPFDFNRRRMSVVVEDASHKTQLITKGAIEEMLQICSFVEYKGNIEPMTPIFKQEILDRVAQYNSEGMRVLGIAHKTNPSPISTFSVKDESEMVLIGYLAFLDPPKESTAAAILALSEYGVAIKVLTGDNDAVTKSVCRQVGLPIEHIMLGTHLDEMDDETLYKAVESTTVFAKLSPQQKVRIVTALRHNGHTVGFMGDGINDAAAMKEADVGISVDTAVDIAKESADIILLEKDLMVLERGVIEGRKTYANIIKYIKMTASSNFGNMFSVLIASAFLPFLPMLPMQLLVLNLIYDISCITIPWDNVDHDFIKVPRNWDASSIVKFMVWIGPSSSIFDITTYLFLYFIVCPSVFGGQFQTLAPLSQAGFIALFHAGWFVESLWSQTLVIHMIRTPLIPFLQSRASWQLSIMTSLGIFVGTVIPYTRFGDALGMAKLPLIYFPFLFATIFMYMIFATMFKRLYIKKYGELL